MSDFEYPGYAVTMLPETASTNTDALALGQVGAPHLSLVVAERQAAGRGRLGRAWVAPAGNVFWSVLVRPERDMAEWGTLALLAGLAVRDAVVALGEHHLRAEDVKVKWPNDVLVRVAGAWRKVSGVLVETAGLGGASPYAVVGVGVNVVAAAEDAVGTFSPTGLQELGLDVDAEAVRQALCAAFLVRYNAWAAGGFAAVLDDYNAALWQHGAEVRVSLDAAKTAFKTGINNGARADGALVVGADAVLVGDVG